MTIVRPKVSHSTMHSFIHTHECNATPISRKCSHGYQGVKDNVVCKKHSHDPSQLAILKVNNKAWECNIFVTCKWTCSTWIVIILPSSNIDSQSRNGLRKSFSMFVTILDKICMFQNKF
jgi:hypothetical protein